MAKLTNSVGMLQQEKGKLATQPQANPQGQHYVAGSSVLNSEQAKSITTLRSGKEINKAIPSKPIKPPVTPIVLQAPDPPFDSPTSEPSPVSEHPEKYQVEEPKVPVSQILAPFPQRLKAPAHANTNSEIYELFKQVRINIPLVDAIKQIPTVFLTEQVSSIIQTNVVPKYKDPGCPTISITIGSKKIEKALLDLGACVNLLLYSVYEQLGLGEMRPTPVTLQLANRSIRVHEGWWRMYLCKWTTLSIQWTSSSWILALGLLNLTFGNMKMEVNVFNIGSEMGNDDCIHEDPLEVCLTAEEVNFLDSSEVEYLCSLLDVEDVCGTEAWSPKFEELPPLECKTLPSSKNETYSVVISSSLDGLQESQLLELLKRDTKAIGRSIADIKGIDASICYHHIALEDDVKHPVNHNSD
ncbi:uncharacterized protein LOC131317431 [Rhododendron vialii]|uniref:uncharacterized protein LOC131317431 n=1 Tax=Rhododendron vialii TaxID=182163 RepID=UPI0026601411|nr:uncharacterized protein LOC131317431 [Rhododendron vialii]